MVDLEKRFYFSPDGGRLNVSAGLPVPEGRLEQEIKASCSNRHGQIVSQHSTAFNCFLPMESGA
jgi:hypothetical protein